MALNEVGEDVEYAIRNYELNLVKDGKADLSEVGKSIEKAIQDREDALAGFKERSDKFDKRTSQMSDSQAARVKNYIMEDYAYSDAQNLAGYIERKPTALQFLSNRYPEMLMNTEELLKTKPGLYNPEQVEIWRAERIVEEQTEAGLN